MKQLTKEEFLDRKNEKVHKELVEAINSVAMNKRLSDYYRETLRDYPSLYCNLNYSKTPLRREITFAHQGVFIDMLEMLKSGELVFKNKGYYCPECNYETNPITNNPILVLACDKHRTKHKESSTN